MSRKIIVLTGIISLAPNCAQEKIPHKRFLSPVVRIFIVAVGRIKLFHPPDVLCRDAFLSRISHYAYCRENLLLPHLPYIAQIFFDFGI